MSSYLTEIQYPVRFHREHAPLWLGSVLTALGVKAPEGRLSYGEIGCGPGFGLLALAAANPDISFHGWDLNPEHIARARDVAARASLGNIRFDVADIARLSPHPVDVLLCHGLHSWVGANTRAAIAAFAGRSVKPGGVFLLHYMTLPGGAAFQAFHALFAALPPGSARIATGLNRLKALQESGAGFFALHPYAAGTLESLMREDPAYVAHDYLTPEFHPLAVADVIAAMGAEGLEHVGSATPIENIDALSLPAQAQDLIAQEPDLTLRETLKDFARNQALRLDLYMKAPQRLAAGDHLNALRRQTFSTLPGAPSSGSLTFSTRIGAVEGPQEIFSPLLNRLASGPATVAELEQFVPQPGLLNQAMQMLLWSGIAHPTRPTGDTAPARRFNRLMMSFSLQGGQVPALAAPSLGSALPPVGPQEALNRLCLL